MDEYHGRLVDHFWSAQADLSGFSGNTRQSWTQISGSLSQISVGTPTEKNPVAPVWGVNSASQIFEYTGDDNDPWTPLPGGLSNVAVNGIYSSPQTGIAWGVNLVGEIYQYNQPGGWSQIAGSLKQIAAGGAIWGVNSVDEIFRYNYAYPPNPPWVRVPGSLSNVSVSFDDPVSSVWGVNSAGEIFHGFDNNPGWTQV